MGKKKENAGFTCIHCLKIVMPLQNGGYRNHCPFCLVSQHVDITPGDRNNGCGGKMIPHRVIFNSKKGWQIIHKCQKCHEEKANVIASCPLQPDDWPAIIHLTSSNSPEAGPKH